MQTEGYSRQVANRQASAALRVWQRYGTTGTGVTTTSIKNVRNEYYDVKYWTNQASVGFYETKLNLFYLSYDDFHFCFLAMDQVIKQKFEKKFRP